MAQAFSLVSRRQPHLKWAVLDPLENILMMLCGFTLFAFSTSVVFDIATRIAGHPWLWLQEVTSTFFIYGIFIGTAVATRRGDHLYLTALSETLTGRLRFWIEIVTRVVTLVVAVCMIVYGYQNFLRGFGSFRMPSLTPIASLYAAIPLSGVLIALFSIEQLVNGWRNGFEHKDVVEELAGAAALSEAFGQLGTDRKST